jgi:hypothetical protein
MLHDSEGYELRVYKVVWYAETGWVDGNGVGLWDHTDVSVKCRSKAEAECVKEEWFQSGKLIKTTWGEYRPPYSYGAFRIRSTMEQVG